MNEVRIIICGFAGIGKTTVAKKYTNIIDLESSEFKWLYTNDQRNIPVEQRKGIEEKKVNPDWPKNYIDEAIKQKEKYDFVLLALSPEIREYMDKLNVEYYLAYPTIAYKQDMINGLILRGNNEAFVKKIEDNYEKWILDLEKIKKPTIRINVGEHLEDALIREFKLHKENNKETEKNNDDERLL